MRHTSMRNVMVVDSHPAVQAGLRSILLASSQLRTTIYEAHGCMEARRLLDIGLVFDLIVLELALPDGSGLDLLDTMMDDPAMAPVLVLSGEEDAQLKQAALLRGIAAFLPKSSSVQTIAAAVQDIVWRSSPPPAGGSHDLQLCAQ